MVRPVVWHAAKGRLVLLQAISETLPAALAIALSPFPIIGVVLIVSSAQGRRNGPLFALGWVVGPGRWSA